MGNILINSKNCYIMMLLFKLIGNSHFYRVLLNGNGTINCYYLNNHGEGQVWSAFIECWYKKRFPRTALLGCGCCSIRRTVVVNLTNLIIPDKHTDIILCLMDQLIIRIQFLDICQPCSAKSWAKSFSKKVNCLCKATELVQPYCFSKAQFNVNLHN